MEYKGRYTAFDPSSISTYPVSDRTNKVKINDLVDPATVSDLTLDVPLEVEESIVHLSREIISAREKFSTIPSAGAIGIIPDLHEKRTLKTFFKYLPVSKLGLENLYLALRSFKKNIIGTPSAPFSNKGIYNVLIARGCLGNCSYCAIRLAHGRLRSVPMEQVVKVMNIAKDNKYKLILATRPE